MAVIKSANAPSLVPFSMADIERHAKSVLLRAQQQAEQLLAAAQMEAEWLKQQATSEGLIAGRKQGTVEGVATGQRSRPAAGAKRASRATPAGDGGAHHGRERHRTGAK